MKIFEFIKSLLPSFSRNRVVEDARISRAQLETVVIPAYSEAERVMSNWSFSSSEVQDMLLTFSRIVKQPRGTNMVVALRGGFDKILALHSAIDDRVKKSFEEEIELAGITFYKVNLIRILELISFTSKYSLKLLNYIYITEGAKLGIEGQLKQSLTPNEIKTIEADFIQFCMAFAILTRQLKDVQTALDTIPDIVAGQGEDLTIGSTIGEHKVDPLGMSNGFGNATHNPIYRIRLLVAEYHANQYKQSLELKKVLELRLLSMERARNNEEPDAALEREINYTQSRVQTLERKLQTQEESVA
jgi:hypothetical protein